MKRVSILGSTGSIEVKALEMIRTHPESLEVVALAAGRNIDLFERQTRKYSPRVKEQDGTIARLLAIARE